MKRLRRFCGYLLVLILLGLGAALYLSDVSFGNRVVKVAPLVHLASVEKMSQVTGPAVPFYIRGRVTKATGEPLADVLVTAFLNDGAYRQTAYSAADGSYDLAGNWPGAIELRARLMGYEDRIKPLNKIRETTIDFTLRALDTPDQLSEPLPASPHAAALKWPDAKTREAFVSQCHFCHQIGNEFTRSPREIETWTEIVDRMEGYLVMITDAQKRTIRDTLAATFTGKPVSAPELGDNSGALGGTIVREWQAGDGNSFIHDAEIGHDGRLYGVDEGNDVMWVAEPASGKLEKIAFPPSDLPVGGKFAGLALPIGIFTGKHGPHSLAQGKDGRFWITNALSSTLMSYQPATGDFQIYPIGGDALYPHTIRLDEAGIVWFTLAASNQVARFDPDSETFTIIQLPADGLAQWITDLFFPLILKTAALFPRSNLHLSLSHHKWFGIGKDALALPYGIDVHPKDGSIWYAKLNGNRIGRIDPESFEITEYDPPLKGPRRPRFDNDGVLWIPAFEDSAILAFDTATKKFRQYRLPELVKGAYETPYALNVHRQTGHVWVTSNQSDRVFRLDPKTGRFLAYPLPTRVSFLRDLVFAKNGDICSSQSNLPALAIEGGVPSFLCIQPAAGR